MSIQKLMTDTANYNQWVTQKYVEWLAQKSDEVLHKTTDSSFPSILLTLDHIWTTQAYWVDKIMERNNFEYNPDRSGVSKEEIFEGYANSSKLLVEYVNSLTEQDISKPVKIEEEYFSCNYEKYQYLQHLVNHGFYHRGQIVTMARVNGITDAPMTDYNFYKVMTEHNQ